MVHPSQTSAFAEWIADFFQTGVTLTDEHRGFMQSTFATEDPTVILDEFDASEIDSFLQLIFYPDQTLCTRYERDWGETLFNTATIEAVMVQLCRAAVRGRIIPGSGQRMLSVELTAGLLRTCLERLKITWQPPLEIHRPLSDIEDKHLLLMIRTHLRHAPIEWHSGQTALMARFLTKMSPQVDSYITSLSDLILLLAEMRVDQSVDSFFIDQKAIFFELLCKSEAFETKRRHQAMEVLMLQGCRAVYGSAAHWRRQISRIDRLSRIMFDTIPDISPLDCRLQRLPL